MANIKKFWTGTEPASARVSVGSRDEVVNSFEAGLDIILAGITAIAGNAGEV